VWRRSSGWDGMPGLVDDEVLDTFAVRGTDGAAVAGELQRRYGALAGRVNLHVGRRADPERRAVLAAVRGWPVRPRAVSEHERIGEPGS
jgi:hypothetical protein